MEAAPRRPRFALWLPRSLRAQFTLGVAVLVLLSAAGGMVAVAALRRSADATGRLAEERLQRVEDAQELVRVTARIERDVDRLVIAADLETLRAAHREISRQLDALDAVVERLGGSSASVSVLDLHASGQSVRNTVHVVAEIRDQLLRRDATPSGRAEDRESLEREADLREFHAELQRQAEALIASAHAVSDALTRDYREAVQALASASARDQALVLGSLVASVAAVVLIARLFLGRKVLGRLQQVSDRLRRGDPGAADSPHLAVSGGDEIAEMARAVEQFVEDRRRLAEADREAERRKAEEALRATEAELARAARILSMGEMAVAIAHEVNQPLAAIVLNGKTCLRWLSGATPNLAEAREGVKHIVYDATRAAEIIAGIRALTGKRAPSDRAPVDLNEVIEQVLMLAGPELQRTRVVFRADLRKDLPLVVADRVQIQQLMLNLFMNASEAMREVSGHQRELLIQTLADADGQVTVAVRDTGVGVEPDARARIFDAFYTTKSGGVGMGLSISRSIVERHGGRLWVEQNEGPGTTFRFTLPVTPSPPR